MSSCVCLKLLPVLKKTHCLLVVFLILSGNLLTAQVPESELNALRILFEATDGENWTNNTNWNVYGGSDDVTSNWHGIIVEDGHVTGIHLERNELRGSLPGEFFNQLPLLTRLNLRDNELTGSLLPEIGNLVSLIEIQLDNNLLSGPIPPEIGNLVNLEHLQLDGNRLTGSIPPEIGNLKNLRFLNLNYMGTLSGEIPMEIWELTKLEVLYLRFGRFTGTIPPEIENLQNLRLLKLNENQLNGVIPKEIGNLPALESLNISSNVYISGMIPSEIGGLSKLKELSIAQNSIEGSIPPEIGNLSNLRTFLAHENKLSGEIPKEIGNMTKLEVLGLNGNWLTGEIPVELENLINMRFLNLGMNQFTGHVPEGFKDFSDLLEFSLAHNQLEMFPDISGISGLYELQIENNRFHFDAIEPNILVAPGRFSYVPQAKVGEEADHYLKQGESLVISVTVRGQNNIYQWFKDDQSIPGANEDAYAIQNFSPAEAGTYVLIIHNSLVEDLVLESEEIRIHLDQSDPPDETTLPEVLSLEAIQVSHDAATLTGEIASDGGEAVLEKGFFLGTDPDPINSGTQYLSEGEAEPFSRDVTGLIPETTYYFIAYATNHKGTGYGEIRSFSTGIEPVEPKSFPGWRYPRMDLAGSNHFDSQSVGISNLLESHMRFPLPGFSNGNILSGDLTGDGKLEIATIQSDQLYVIRHDGSLYSTANVAITGQNPKFTQVAFLDDFSRDGIPDIAISYSRPEHDNGPWKARFYTGDGNLLTEFSWTVNQDGRLVPMALVGNDILVNHSAIWSRNPRGFSRWNLNNGERIWEFNVGPYSLTPSIADINGNGLLEISMGAWTPHNGASGNGTTDSSVYTIIIDENGERQIIQEYPGTAAERKGSLSEMFVPFKQGYRLVSFKGHSSSYPGRSRIHIRELDGTILYTYMGEETAYWNFGWGDLDKDGRVEIVATNHSNSRTILSIFDSELSTQYSVELPKDYFFQLIADVDGNGYKNIIVSGDDGKIIVFDHQLNLLFEVEMSDPSRVIKVISSDFNGSGRVDLAAISEKEIELFIGVYLEIPEVETMDADEITQVSAIVGGEVISDGGSAVQERGILWGTDPDPITNGKYFAADDGLGAFIVSLEDLDPETTYYFTAYATNGVGTGYGETLSFKTLAEIMLPLVMTADPIDIQMYSAVVGGEIVSDGGSEVMEQGVFWGINNDSVQMGVRIQAEEGPDNFSLLLENLLPATLYYVAAYAINEAGTAYGEVKSFETKQIELFIPNAFMPESHLELNRVFKPIFQNIPSVYSLTVFNRWGSRIFISEDPEIGWDGTAEGGNAPQGGYVYKLIYKDPLSEEDKTHTGVVMLIR